MIFHSPCIAYSDHSIKRVIIGGGGGSLQLWAVHHTRPQLLKKFPKNGFYLWLKWHPKHVTQVFFDTLNREFCSCVRFSTINTEYCVISSVILYPKQGSIFHTQNKGNSIGKDLVTSSGQSGHTPGTQEA